MLSDFVSLLYPTLCNGCDLPLKKGEKHICVSCFMAIPQTDYHLELHNPITTKFYGKIKINRAMAYFSFTKGGKLQKVMHKLKYKEAQEMGEYLGKQYGVLLKQHNMSKLFDLIVPVPLHKHKLLKRGFNQAEVISKGLSEGLSVEHAPHLIVRNVFTETQTKKNRIERWKNVENIFTVTDHKKVKGKNMVIVDDVITTGSTIEACAHAFLDSGAKSISVICLAVAK